MRNSCEESYHLLATEGNSKTQQTATEDAQKSILYGLTMFQKHKLIVLCKDKNFLTSAVKHIYWILGTKHKSHHLVTIAQECSDNRQVTETKNYMNEGKAGSGLFSLQKRRLWDDLTAAFQYLNGAYKKWRGTFYKDM